MGGTNAGVTSGFHCVFTDLVQAALLLAELRHLVRLVEALVHAVLGGVAGLHAGQEAAPVVKAGVQQPVTVQRVLQQHRLVVSSSVTHTHIISHTHTKKLWLR